MPEGSMTTWSLPTQVLKTPQALIKQRILLLTAMNASDATLVHRVLEHRLT